MNLLVGALMISHHSGIVCGHKHCGNKDIMFLMVEEQQFHMPLFKPSVTAYLEST